MSIDSSLPTSEMQARAREFARRRVARGASKRDLAGEFPLDIFKEAGKLGFCGVALPAEYGGSGSLSIDFGLVMEEFGAVDASFAVIVESSGVVGNIIWSLGNEEQRRTYLPPIASGEVIPAYALSEPHAGSDVKAMRTTAERVPGGYILRGRKAHVNNSLHAGLFLVFAKTEEGHDAFIVERGIQGLEVGRQLIPTGLRSATLYELKMNDCFVPESARMGEPGRGVQTAMKALDYSKIGVASICIGLARGALEFAIAYAKKRSVFGQHVADFQAIQHAIADMSVELDAARLLRDRAAVLHDEHRRGGRLPVRESFAAKLYASELAVRVTFQCMQICGAQGCYETVPLGRFSRDAQVITITSGTSQIHRNIIARSVLKDGLGPSGEFAGRAADPRLAVPGPDQLAPEQSGTPLASREK